MIQPTLKTARLIVRPYQLTDAADVQRLAGDRRISAMTANIPYPYEDGMAEDWIESRQLLWQSLDAVAYAITSAKTGELIGTVSLTKYLGHFGNLGYWIGVPYWGQGFATEASKALVQFAFETLDRSLLYAQHLEINKASGQVIRKCGFQLKGSRIVENRAVLNYELTQTQWRELESKASQS